MNVTAQMRAWTALLFSTLLLLGGQNNASGRSASGEQEGSRRVRQSTARQSDSDELVYGNRLDVAALERLVFDCVNQERSRYRLRPFAPDGSLHRVARLHSADMAARNYFSHDSKRGFMRSTGFGDRLRGNGVVCARMAENIAMLPLVRSRRMTYRTDSRGRRNTEVQEARLGYRELAQWAVQQWMESPGHRKNILDPALDTMGIGVALGNRDGEEYVYLTQDFGGR